MEKLIRTSELPENEIAICKRFAEIRKKSGLSQAAFAKEIGIPLGSVSNYEYGKTALRADIALRACHTYLANERWLATGEGDWQPCVDLFGELSIQMQLKRGELYSEAFARVLAKEHDRLEQMPNDELVMRLLKSELNTSDRLHRIFAFTEYFFSILLSLYRIQAQIKKEQLLDTVHSGMEIEEIDRLLEVSEKDFLQMFYQAGIDAALRFFSKQDFDAHPIIPAMRNANKIQIR